MLTLQASSKMTCFRASNGSITTQDVSCVALSARSHMSYMSLSDLISISHPGHGEKSRWKDQQLWVKCSRLKFIDETIGSLAQCEDSIIICCDLYLYDIDFVFGSGVSFVSYLGNDYAHTLSPRILLSFKPTNTHTVGLRTQGQHSSIPLRGCHHQSVC